MLVVPLIEILTVSDPDMLTVSVAEPPVAPGETPGYVVSPVLFDAPSINLSLKSGILNVDDPFPEPCVVPTTANRAAYVDLLIAEPSHKK